MRLLFVMDSGDHPPGGRVFVRDSARAIIIRDGKVAMVRSRLYDYYKFPGGGIEAGEAPETAMVRETREEAGLRVKLRSIKSYGVVHRVSKSDHPDADIFQQDNYYYLCDTGEAEGQQLDAYEAEEGFHLTWVAPETAIEVNRFHYHGGKDQTMLEREARVLEMLIREGYFPESKPLVN